MANVDLEDVQRHANLAEDWWDPKGPVKGLHALNEVRVPFFRDCLISSKKVKVNLDNQSHILDGFKILEVGCGAGILTEPLAKLGAEVVGIDPAEELIALAKGRLLNDLKVTYICETIEDHSSKFFEKYDCVVASEVVDHVKEKEPFLKACTDALKPGGSIFVTTFNKNTLSWLCVKIAAEYILSIIPKGTHDWNQFISPEEISIILEHFNCDTIKVQGLNYNFFTGKSVFTSSAILQYALHATKRE